MILRIIHDNAIFTGYSRIERRRINIKITAGDRLRAHNIIESLPAGRFRINGSGDAGQIECLPADIFTLAAVLNLQNRLYDR